VRALAVEGLETPRKDSKESFVPAASSLGPPKSQTGPGNMVTNGRQGVAKPKKRGHSRIVAKQSSRVNALGVEGLDKPKKGGLASRWLQQQQERKAKEFEAERNKIRARRARGVKHVDQQIRMLILQIKKLSVSKGHSSPVPGALCKAVTFGDLFASTQGVMPALAGTLQQAKKRGVVSYEGDMLQQSYHDHVLISLLKDKVADSKVYKSVYMKKPIDFHATSNNEGPATCDRCGKTVLPLERLAVSGCVFHKTCFKCASCSRTLKLAEYASSGGRGNKTFYCKPCYLRQVNKAGGKY